MTEIDKNVLQDIENNKKVELVVKRDDSAHAGELDLVRVFYNMGKKKRIYACIIIICMLIGFAAPLLMAQFRDRTESVSIVVNLLYPGARYQQAPDGNKLDLNYIKSSYILQRAIKRTQLSENLPISALESNISIETLLTEETRQKLEVVEKVINETSKDYNQVLDVDYEYEGKFIVTIKNGFSTNPEAKSKIYLDGNEMSALLNNIAEEYTDYFYNTYLDMRLPDNTLDSINNTELDYIERLDEIVALLDSLSSYCNSAANSQYHTFRSNYDGLSFADISDCINLVRDIDVDYLYAYVFYNSVSKNTKSMMTKYTYQLKNNQRNLNAVLGNIKDNNALISEYKNAKINISSADKEEMQESMAVTDYYNSLIMDQANNYSRKASLGESIANLNDKVAGFKDSNSSTAMIEYVESEFNNLMGICSALFKLTEDHANEILVSGSYRNSLINYIGAQFISDSIFSASNIKKVIIGMVVGAFLAVAIWGMDGLIEEFKRGSSLRNEATEGGAKA